MWNRTADYEDGTSAAQAFHCAVRTSTNINAAQKSHEPALPTALCRACLRAPPCRVSSTRRHVANQLVPCGPILPTIVANIVTAELLVRQRCTALMPAIGAVVGSLRRNSHVVVAHFHIVAGRQTVAVRELALCNRWNARRLQCSLSYLTATCFALWHKSSRRCCPGIALAARVTAGRNAICCRRLTSTRATVRTRDPAVRCPARRCLALAAFLRVRRRS